MPTLTVIFHVGHNRSIFKNKVPVHPEKHRWKKNQAGSFFLDTLFRCEDSKIPLQAVEKNRN